MKKNLVLWMGAVVLFGSARAAFAGAYGETEQTQEGPAATVVTEATEEKMDCAKPGFYIGVGGEYAFEKFDQHGQSGSNVANSAGFHVRAGYRMHPNAAVELLYENFHEFDVDPDGHYDGWALTANGKIFAMTGCIQPYALLGLGYIDMARHGATMEAKPGDDFTMRFGGGIDVCVHERVSVGPEVAYLLPFANADDMDMVTLGMGLQFKF